MAEAPTGCLNINEALPNMGIIEDPPFPFLSFIVFICLIKRGCLREMSFSQRPPAMGGIAFKWRNCLT